MGVKKDLIQKSENVSLLTKDNTHTEQQTCQKSPLKAGLKIAFSREKNPHENAIVTLFEKKKCVILSYWSLAPFDLLRGDFIAKLLYNTWCYCVSSPQEGSSTKSLLQPLMK